MLFARRGLSGVRRPSHNAAAGHGQLSTEPSGSSSLEAIMGLQVSYFVCLSIGLSACGEHAYGEEPAPIKKLSLPGEAFLVEGRTAFVFLPPQKDRCQPLPWILYAPTLPPYP